MRQKATSVGSDRCLIAQHPRQVLLQLVAMDLLNQKSRLMLPDGTGKLWGVPARRIFAHAARQIPSIFARNAASAVRAAAIGWHTNFPCHAEDGSTDFDVLNHDGRCEWVHWIWKRSAMMCGARLAEDRTLGCQPRHRSHLEGFFHQLACTAALQDNTWYV